MVAVVDTVAKDVELQQRLTSSVNQLVTNIFQTQTMQSQTFIIFKRHRATKED